MTAVCTTAGTEPVLATAEPGAAAVTTALAAAVLCVAAAVLLGCALSRRLPAASRQPAVDADCRMRGA